MLELWCLIPEGAVCAVERPRLLRELECFYVRNGKRKSQINRWLELGDVVGKKIHALSNSAYSLSHRGIMAPYLIERQSNPASINLAGMP